MNLTNKTILITGGSEGLGFALAKELLSQKSEIIICGRSREKLNDASKKLNSNKLRTFVCDVSDYNQVQMMVKNITNLDILINNAGIFMESPIESSNPSEISNVINVNVKGVIYVTKACIPLLKRRKESYLLNISSTKGIEGEENLSVYSASKFAVQGFTESLQLELKETNIKVFGFYPASMDTTFHLKTGVVRDRSNWMTVEEVAEVIGFALSRPDPMMFDKLVLRNK